MGTTPAGRYCGRMNMQSSKSIKVLGRRTVRESSLPAAAKFLDMMIAIGGHKPFIPRGVHRFSTFEESQQRSIRMMARRRHLDPRS